MQGLILIVLGKNPSHRTVDRAVNVPLIRVFRVYLGEHGFAKKKRKKEKKRKRNLQNGIQNFNYHGKGYTLIYVFLS